MEASEAKEPEDEGRTLGDDLAEDAAASTLADVIPARGPAAYVAEFIGTFTLVLFITLVVSEFVSKPMPPVTPGAQAVTPFIDWSVIGLVHVFVLFFLIQTLAVVSGAHFNPAVTAALTAVRQIRPIDAAIYIVVQLAGAVLGALGTKLILNNFDNAKAVHFGAPAVSDALAGKVGLGMLVEGLGTFFLVWAIVGVAVNPRSDRGWAALVSGEWGGFDDFVITYVLAPVIGAVLAALVYFRMVIAPGKKGPAGMEPVG